MKTRRTWECNKAAFLATWPGGYDENFEVYTPVAGLTEEEIVNTCLKPFYNPHGTALEIGCGKGYWVRKYLLPNFRRTIGKDVIPRAWVDVGLRADKFIYLEAGERDYNLDTLADNSIDFIWSFGVFCHISCSSILEYLKAAHRVLKVGHQASLYFSDSTKRPPGEWTSEPDPDQVVGWTENDWQTTVGMLQEAQFTGIEHVLTHGKDTMVIASK